MAKREHNIEMRISPQESGNQETYGFSFPFRVSFGKVVFPWFGCLVLFDRKKREISPDRHKDLSHYCIDRVGYDKLEEITHWRDNWEEYWKQQGWSFDVIFPCKPETHIHMLRRAIQGGEKSWVEEDHHEANTYLPVTVDGEPGIPPAFLHDVSGNQVSVEMVECLLKRGKRLMPNMRSMILTLSHANVLYQTWHVYKTVNGYSSRSIHPPIIFTRS